MHQFPKPPRGHGPHLPTPTHMACPLLQARPFLKPLCLHEHEIIPNYLQGAARLSAVV